MDTYIVTNNQLVKSDTKLTLTSYNLPLDYSGNLISQSGYTIRIIMHESFGGCVIKCNLRAGLCSFLIPGDHFSKVIGLLGQNNYESDSVDKSRRIIPAQNALSQWTLKGISLQESTNKSSLMIPWTKVLECQREVLALKNDFCEMYEAQLRIASFIKMCENVLPDACAIAAGYKTACISQGPFIYTPQRCSELPAILTCVHLVVCYD